MISILIDNDNPCQQLNVKEYMKNVLLMACVLCMNILILVGPGPGHTVGCL